MLLYVASALQNALADAVVSESEGVADALFAAQFGKRLEALASHYKEEGGEDGVHPVVAAAEGALSNYMDAPATLRLRAVVKAQAVCRGWLGRTAGLRTAPGRQIGLRLGLASARLHKATQLDTSADEAEVAAGGEGLQAGRGGEGEQTAPARFEEGEVRRVETVESRAMRTEASLLRSEVAMDVAAVLTELEDEQE
ncbi:hypothetical protein T492DRAFT_885069, partial [Pavlovales sp. CCMP2436]